MKTKQYKQCCANKLSSLLKAIELKKHTAKVGFDFPNVNSALIKLDEEIQEIKQAIKNQNRENMFEEIGDALFMLANVAEKIGVNPELSLKHANKKFEKRFKAIERKMQEANIPLTKENVDKMEKYWDEVKQNIH